MYPSHLGRVAANKRHRATDMAPATAANSLASFGRAPVVRAESRYVQFARPTLRTQQSGDGPIRTDGAPWLVEVEAQCLNPLSHIAV